MKNIIGTGLMCLFGLGCGDLFVPGTGTTTSNGGRGGNDAGMSSGGTNETTTSVSLTGSITVTNEMAVVHQLVSSEKDFVYRPWIGYSLDNSPIISCISVPEGKSLLRIYSYGYTLFEGTAPLPEPTCVVTEHVTISAKVDPSVSINDVLFDERQANTDQIVWSDWKTNEYDGRVGNLNVDVSDPVVITENEVFCFGHRVALDAFANPTCDVGIITQDVDYQQHLISDTDTVPYNFNTLDNWPVDGDVSKKISLLSSVLASEE